MLSSSGSLVRLVPTARNSGRTRDTARTLPSASTRAANIQGAGPRLPVLIVSALDGTMVGNDEYTLAFRQNGRALDDPHLDYKLRWLEALGEHYRSYQDQPGALPVAIGGDFNVAPLDSDVGDPAFLVQGTTHTSDLERTTLQDFLHRAGLQDTVRPLVPTGYTYWDYKQGKFPKDHGMRIDFIFGSESFASQVTHASIERDQRQGDGPSDHVPVVVEVGAEDDFDRPMVF